MGDIVTVPTGQRRTGSQLNRTEHSVSHVRQVSSYSLARVVGMPAFELRALICVLRKHSVSCLLGPLPTKVNIFQLSRDGNSFLRKSPQISSQKARNASGREGATKGCFPSGSADPHGCRREARGGQRSPQRDLLLGKSSKSGEVWGPEGKGGRGGGPLQGIKVRGGGGGSGHRQKRLAVGSKGDLFPACHLDGTFQSPAETRGQRDERLRSGGAAPPRL